MKQKIESSRIGLLDINYPKIIKVVFHDSFFEEYMNMDTIVKPKVDRIFKELFFGEKKLDSYEYHSESETVKTNQKLSEERKVKFGNLEKIIYMHIKVTQDWSIYTEISNNKLYFGRLSSHLSTKKY